MSFGAALNAIAGGPAAPQAATPGIGQPPKLPGTPPAPTGVGAMPTGNASIDAKGSADQAILALRECSGYFPNLRNDIDALIAQLKSAATPPKGPGPSVGAADAGPAIGGSETAPGMESGSPGGF